MEDWDSSRDGSELSPNGDHQKQKQTGREPESPPVATVPPSGGYHYNTTNRDHGAEPMDTDSPASYPKHVLIPANEATPQRHHAHAASHVGYPDLMGNKGKLNTPPLAHESPYGNRHGYKTPMYPPLPPYQYPGDMYSNPPSAGYHHQSHHNPSGHYIPHDDVASPHPYHSGRGVGMSSTAHGPHGGGSGSGVMVRPRRWACDYCSVATFLSYEDAVAHEETCARRHEPYPRIYPLPPPPPPQQQQQQQQQQQGSGHYHSYAPPPPQVGGGGVPAGGLGALYHASQEVQQRHVVPPHSPHAPPIPPHHHMPPPRVWGAPPHHHPRGGPPPPPPPPPPQLLMDPHSPHHHHHFQQQHQQHQQQQQQHQPPHHMQHHPHHPGMGYKQLMPRFQGYASDRDDALMSTHEFQKPQRRMMLAMTTDVDSLSDRQCFVRAEMVEIFAATEKDVAARHSKGAQKLVAGQVGIRCVYCSHLRPRDRAERAVCYPSSISRVYQTVADMQRFHFEQCREIPDEVRKRYKGLKTTRPRGVGSPQTYWVQSAKLLDLVDTEEGIRFGADLEQEGKTPAIATGSHQPDTPTRMDHSSTDGGSL